MIEGIKASTFFRYSRNPTASAIIISIFTGRTAVGILTKSPAIAMAKTANTSQLNIMTKIRNIVFTRLLIMVPVMSAIVFPFSRTDTTSAPKS